MADSYTNSASSAGAARGIANANRSFTNHMNPQAVAGRQEARLMKAQSDEALRRAKATRASDEDLAAMGEANSLAIKDALNQAKAANMASSRTITFQGFEQFEADGNTNHINTALETLRQNPVGKNLFEGITRVDKLGPGDDELLRPLGITFEDFQREPELNKMFVRATMADGSPQLLPMDAVYAGTRYDKYRTDQALEEAGKRADIFYKTQARSLAGGSAAERIAHTMTVQAMPQGFPEADWKPGNPEYDAVYIEKFQENKSRPEPQTQAEAEATRETLLARPEDISEEDWVKGNTAYDAAYQNSFRAIRARDLQTSGQKEQAQVRSTRDSILARAEAAGQDFFDMDFSDRSNRLKYEQDVEDMMRLGKIELSAEDKRTASYVHELLNLGGTASSGITDDQAGIIDTLTRSVGAYVSNKSAGFDVTSAYAAFRNTVRNALFGSALTDGEITAFNEAFGTIKQQTGPVLNQFRTGLVQVKSRLESLMNTNNSVVSHFYLGADQRKITEMVEALDERIELLDSSIAGQTPGAPEATIDVTDPDNPVVETPRPSLDDLYDGIIGGGAQ